MKHPKKEGIVPTRKDSKSKETRYVDISNSAYEDAWKLFSGNFEYDQVHKVIYKEDGSKKCPLIRGFKFNRLSWIRHFQEALIVVPTFKKAIDYIIIDVDNHNNEGDVKERVSQIRNILGDTVATISSKSGGVHLHYKLSKRYNIDDIRKYLKTLIGHLKAVDICPAKCRLPFGKDSKIYLDDCLDADIIIGAKYNQIVYFNNNIKVITLDIKAHENVNKSTHSTPTNCISPSKQDGPSGSAPASMDTHTHTSSRTPGVCKNSYSVVAGEKGRREYSKMFCEGANGGVRYRRMVALFNKYPTNRLMFEREVFRLIREGEIYSRDYTHLADDVLRRRISAFWTGFRKRRRVFGSPSGGARVCAPYTKEMGVIEEECRRLIGYLPTSRAYRTKSGVLNDFTNFTKRLYTLYCTFIDTNPEAEEYQIPSSLLNKISPRYKQYIHIINSKHNAIRVTTDYKYHARKCRAYSTRAFVPFRQYITAILRVKQEYRRGREERNKGEEKYSKMFCDVLSLPLCANAGVLSEVAVLAAGGFSVRPP